MIYDNDELALGDDVQTVRMDVHARKANLHNEMQCQISAHRLMNLLTDASVVDVLHALTQEHGGQLDVTLHPRPHNGRDMLYIKMERDATHAIVRTTPFEGEHNEQNDGSDQGNAEPESPDGELGH